MLSKSPCRFKLRIGSQKNALQKSLSLNRTRLNQLFIQELLSLPYIPDTTSVSEVVGWTILDMLGGDWHLLHLGEYPMVGGGVLIKS